MKRKEAAPPPPKAGTRSSGIPPRRTRIHRKAITFNDAEMKAVSDFCRKYKIGNRAKFFRETIIAAILRKTEEDHPKLF